MHTADTAKTSRTCAACGHPVRAGLPMCAAHWRLVPHVLQHAIARSWRAWRSCRAGTRRANLARAYQRDCDAAIATVRLQLEPDLVIHPTPTHGVMQ